MAIDFGDYFPIEEYYDKVVKPIDKRFNTSKNGKFICCLHDDKDPSLGIIHNKSKGEVFHCFGCNAWGTVVDLHKRVSLKYFRKSIDDNMAIRELCDLFGVDYKSLQLEETPSFDSVADKDIRKELAMREALNRFGIDDFREGIIQGKIEGRGIPYFNSLLVMMINEMKVK